MIGQQIGRYRIEREIGRGGMGVVYEGTQVTLDRRVAIKMLASHLADADSSARFQREALTLAKLAHPNIIHIYDVEEFQGSQFIVMEYVGGGSFGDLLEKSPVLPPDRVVGVLAPVLGGLAAAHEKGIVHRDIKPDNILFSDSGRPKLTDFGIAHMRGANSKTRTGVMLGTPYYMSPEQARGRPVTPASDLYATGVVMYEALTGRVPFVAEDAVSVALMHVQDEAEPIENIRPEIPSALCDVVRRAMAKDPADRFESAAAMEDALLSGGWAPRTSGSGAAVSVAATSHDSAAVTSGATVAGASDTGSRLAGLSDSVSKLGQGTTGIFAATGTFLRRPAWRGMPMAFWLGAAAVAAVALVGGVQAMSSGGGTPGSSSATISEGDATATSGPGEGRRRGNTMADLPAERQATRLTPDQSRGLGTPGSDDNQIQSGPSQPERQERDPTPEPEPDRADPIVPVDPDPEPELDKPEDVVEEPDDSAWQATASREIRAVIDRQGRGLENQNRSLFLRDMHPSVKAEAAENYDLAVAAADGFEVEASNIEIAFEGRDAAVVVFMARISMIDRATGFGSTADSQEVWYLVQEGGRWWIVGWEEA